MNRANCQIDLHSIPSPPSVAVALLELFSDPEAGIDDVTNVIRVDPALCAKIISHSNSAAIGLPRTVDSIERATVCLGMNAVRMIALSFSLTETADDSGFDFSKFWNRSLAFAVSSQALCREKEHDADLGFLTGLMLNIGEIGLYRGRNTDIYDEARILETSMPSLIAFENENLGTNRFQVASEILAQWGFPDEILETLINVSSEREPSELEKTIVMGWNLATLFTNTELSEEEVFQLKSCLLTNLEFDEGQLEQLFDESQRGWLDFSKMLGHKNEWNPTSIREIENSARIKMASLSVAQIQQHKVYENEIEELKTTATKDALTGINNRRAYDEFGSKTFVKCQRDCTPISIIVIDIDRFKLFNDTHGHKIGDQALKHVATVLSDHLRDYDNLFRYGGEEFVVLLPGIADAGAVNVAERLRRAVGNFPVTIADTKLPVSISAGIASCKNAINGSFELLFENADESLYIAKENGRNRCELHSSQHEVAIT